MTQPFTYIRIWIAVMVVMSTLSAAARAAAAELVLFEIAGCPYCEAWNREVGGVYHLTDEAGLLPLRRVDMDAPTPADLAGIRDIRYSPTFVVMDAGREVGRIVGYHGEVQFWGLLGEIIATLQRDVD